MKHQIPMGMLLSIGLGLIVLLPIFSILWLALGAENTQWSHLFATVLPRYLRNSLILMAGVGGLSMVLGTGLAFVVTHLEFPGRKVIQYALFLPLAMPAFVAAYSWVELLEFAGPVQSFMRALMSWNSSRDYWFPNIRSLPGAILVLSLTLYPYVYLLARASFKELPASGQDAARTLGLGFAQQFLGVALPQARPAIAAGTAIVMMETINDFGTVDYFAVQTLTTGIFSLWLESYNAGAAAQLACFAVMIVAALLLVEKIGRKGARFNKSGRQVARIHPQIPQIGIAYVSVAFCVLPILLGFAVPLFVLIEPTLTGGAFWGGISLWRAALHSLMLGGVSSILVVTLAGIMVIGFQGRQQRWRRHAITSTTLGYAFPGAVLGLGILLPLAAFDNWFADRVLEVFGLDPGLLLTGSAAALVIAYSVRFFAIGVGAAEAGLSSISSNIPAAARSLGAGKKTLVWRIYQPLMRGSLGSALVLVFVDSLKELPATLLLRPFNFETLSTHIYGQASLENFNGAAPGALLIVFFSLGAIILLAKANR